MPNEIGNLQPVTVVTSQVVKPGAEEEFEALIKSISTDLLSSEGCLGLDVIRPADHAHPEFVTIFRFDSYESSKRWRLSDAHDQWMQRVIPLADDEAREEVVTGMEYWLTPKVAAGPIAPHSKQAFVIWIGIYPLVTILIWLMEPYLGGLPLFLRTLILTVILVLLMTYLVMPFLMRHLSGWLNAR